MALLHPSAPLAPPLTRGVQREHDVLRLLEAGLPESFDVFHSVDWSCVFEGRQLHGEIDVAVVAPNGHIVLLEIKAGPVIESDTALGKQYGAGQIARTKDVGHQVRRLYAGLRSRLHDAGLGHARVLSNCRTTATCQPCTRDCSTAYCLTCPPTIWAGATPPSCRLPPSNWTPPPSIADPQFGQACS